MAYIKQNWATPMVLNCFDIESCVNAFLEPQFFCRRRMNRKKREYFHLLRQEVTCQVWLQTWRGTVGGRSPQVFLCCCLQGLEALAQLNLAVAWIRALRLLLTPPADQRDGTVQRNRLWTSALQPTPWFMGFAQGYLSSGDNPSLLQVSLQAHPFLSAPPQRQNLNAGFWAALAALNETQAKSLFRSFSLMPPGLMWGAPWKMERPFKWPFLPADVHCTRQISPCIQEPDIGKASLHKHWRQIRPNAFVMARALLMNFVIWQPIFPPV